MKVLITGGAGFIGSNIARKMLDKGYEVTILDNLSRINVNKNLNWVKDAEFIYGDILKPSDIKKTGKPDAIVHCAANPGIPKSIKYPKFDLTTNTIGTINILEHAKKTGASVVYCSTNKVYPENLINSIPIIKKKKRYTWKKPFSKTDNVGGAPHSPYGISKLAGDLYCQEYNHVFGVPTIVNRMSCIYGTHQYGVEEQGWVAHFVFSALTNKKLNIYGNGLQVRDCLYGEDLAELVIKEIENIHILKGSVFNVGGGMKNTLSLIECIDFLEKEIGIEFKIKDHGWRPADHKVYISDIKPLEKLWKPKTSVEEGMKKLIDWAKEAI